MGSITEIVYSGQLLLALPLALLAGLVSFASPCVLPLVPGYLGFLGGASGTTETAVRTRLVLAVLLFVLGFSTVFVALSTLAGSLGAFVLRYQDLIIRVSGVVVIILGLAFMGRIGILQRAMKPTWRPRQNLASAPVLGVIFAVGWTPCFGPALAAISALSLQGGDPARGALLGLAYGLGLGVPFVLLAAGLSWAQQALTWLRRNVRRVNVVGGVMLIATGALMVSGLWSMFVNWLGGLAFVTLV